MDRYAEMGKNTPEGYLQHLQALALEIDSAMSAIATNSLAKFQTSVAKQEALCCNLSLMANSGLAVGADAEMESRTRATIKVIRKLTLEYAALLRHSSKSAKVLLSLCESHTGQLDGAQRMQARRGTWSCEV